MDIGLLEGGCEAWRVAWQQQHAERTVRRTVGQAQPISYLNAAVSSHVLGNQCHRAGEERAQACWARVQKTRQNPNKAPPARPRLQRSTVRTEVGAHPEARRGALQSVRAVVDPLLDAMCSVTHAPSPMPEAAESHGRAGRARAPDRLDTYPVTIMAKK